MRICLIPTDTWGVGSYRCLQPGRQLEKHGHEVFVHIDQHRYRPGGPLPVLYQFNPDGTTSTEFDADVYVFQRRMDKLTPPAVRQLRRNNRAVVGEIDDGVDLLPQSSPAWRMLHRYPDHFRIEWMNEAFRFCDALTVSTPALADLYRKYNPNVHVLPNYLDWNMWADVRPQYEVVRNRPRVGWMGWLDWRDNDLDILKHVIPGFLKDNPDVQFVSIGEPRRPKPGHVSVHDYLEVPRRQRATVHGVPYRQLAEIVPTIDIGLVPLALTGFNDCKSYLKGLEYAACGIPSIASPTEPYRSFMRPGTDGLLATSADEWRDALQTLVADDVGRRRMGAAARAKAETMTIQEHWPKWESLYTSSLSERSTASTPATPGSSATVPSLAA